LAIFFSFSFVASLTLPDYLPGSSRASGASHEKSAALGVLSRVRRVDFRAVVLLNPFLKAKRVYLIPAATSSPPTNDLRPVAREADLERDAGEARSGPPQVERAQQTDAIQVLVDGPARDLTEDPRQLVPVGRPPKGIAAQRFLLFSAGWMPDQGVADPPGEYDSTAFASTSSRVNHAGLNRRSE
jgi:hypothetical protein